MGRAVLAGDRGDDLKTSWPELVGWVMLNAADKINIDRPDLFPAFYVLPTPLPTDYDPRVILVGDDRDVVVRTTVIS